jgi:hypothetical protein
VLQRIKLGKEKLYADPESGGIGLINIEHFLVAQQAVWIGRAYRSSKDCWRADLRSVSCGNVLTIYEKDTFFDNIPVLKAAVTSFGKVRDAFIVQNDNFWKMFIYNNPNLKRGPDDVRLLDKNFFAPNGPQLDMRLVAKLKIEDFFLNGIFRERQNLIDSTGCFLTS